MMDADEDLLHRAIYNLLLNAVQASPPGGEIRIEAGELSAAQLPQGNQKFEKGAYAILILTRVQVSRRKFVTDCSIPSSQPSRGAAGLDSQ